MKFNKVINIIFLVAGVYSIRINSASHLTDDDDTTPHVSELDALMDKYDSKEAKPGTKTVAKKSPASHTGE